MTVPPPNTTARRWGAALEPAAIFALIMLYIWQFHRSAPAAWIPILSLMLASHRIHGEGARMLGFRGGNFARSAQAFAPALLLAALALLSLGMLLQTTRRISLEQGMAGFAEYCLWGLFQQYVLNGYFVNRLADAAPEPLVPALAGSLFAAVHTPNWFLMPVGFAAGYLSASVYLRYRNLYFLGLAHGAIGSLLFLVIPDAVSRHLRVGPGWLAH